MGADHNLLGYDSRDMTMCVDATDLLVAAVSPVLSAASRAAEGNENTSLSVSWAGKVGNKVDYEVGNKVGNKVE